MTPPLKIAIAGLGTVGAEVARQIIGRQEALALKAGRPLALIAVSARDKAKHRGIPLGGIKWFDDPVAMARGAEFDVLIELMGGEGDPARASVAVALGAGKPVITANKALIAHHGIGLARMAEQHGTQLRFEAAVAGGIPIIKALREGLAANEVKRLYGILNGTCNYILTTMEASGRAFADVLQEAQAKGYAEADPTFDVDGLDTGHKLVILSALAFGMAPTLDDLYVQGIRHITPMDIAFAHEFGYRIKLLGIAEKIDGRVSQRVHTAMVRLGSPLADVDGVFNAVVAEGDLVGTSVYEGRGAGAGPTASAVLSDLIDVARGHTHALMGRPAATLERPEALPMGDLIGPYYLRLRVLDRPGVLASVARTLADRSISIESMIQRGRAPGEAVQIVMITHEAREEDMGAALAAIARSDIVIEEPCMIRMERV